MLRLQQTQCMTTRTFVCDVWVSIILPHASVELQEIYTYDLTQTRDLQHKTFNPLNPSVYVTHHQVLTFKNSTFFPQNYLTALFGYQNEQH